MSFVGGGDVVHTHLRGGIMPGSTDSDRQTQIRKQTLRQTQTHIEAETETHMQTQARTEIETQTHTPTLPSLPLFLSLTHLLTHSLTLTLSPSPPPPLTPPLPPRATTTRSPGLTRSARNFPPRFLFTTVPGSRAKTGRVSTVTVLLRR